MRRFKDWLRRYDGKHPAFDPGVHRFAIAYVVQLRLRLPRHARGARQRPMPDATSLGELLWAVRQSGHPELLPAAEHAWRAYEKEAAIERTKDDDDIPW